MKSLQYRTEKPYIVYKYIERNSLKTLKNFSQTFDVRDKAWWRNALPFRVIMDFAFIWLWER